MNRRELTRLFGAGLLVSALTPGIAAARAAPRVSVTMDDFNVRNLDDAVAGKRNRAILDALRAHSIKAALFVAGINVDSPYRRKLLEQWDDAGHLICNHTWSHRNYASSDFKQYSADFLRCDALIKDFRNYRKLFRFPYLKEGTTAEHRDAMRQFLADQGYSNGAVTIDASDWYIDQRLSNRLTADPKASTAGFRDYYLHHMLDRSAYYDDVSQKALGRSVKHTLLVHHNLINELHLGDLLTHYQAKGWKLIDAADAYRDPVFKETPDTLPAGDSLVLAIGVQSGKVQRLRWPSEDGDYEAPAMDRLGL